jgi:hypothetical protein
MVEEIKAGGLIPSKPLVISGKVADNSISRLLKEAAKKTPQKEPVNIDKEPAN